MPSQLPSYLNFSFLLFLGHFYALKYHAFVEKQTDGIEQIYALKHMC